MIKNSKTKLTSTPLKNYFSSPFGGSVRRTIGVRGWGRCRKGMMGLFIILSFASYGQTPMANIDGRKTTSLNGTWQAIIDQYSCGHSMRIYQNRTPKTKSDFVEYSFEDGLTLHVPGDFNSQQPELKYYESSVWYKKDFSLEPQAGKRYFIYFGAVNYLAEVYLNGQYLGKHTGGFSPFQFEITDKLRSGDNFVVVHVNNARSADAIPALKYDWWNYGGITRDVLLVETPQSYIYDYSVRLAKNSMRRVEVKVRLSNSSTPQQVRVSIPEAKISQTVVANGNEVSLSFDAKLQLWSPESPKLYDVFITTPNDTIQERIGFRCVQVQGTDILLNGKPVFLRGINVHDEIATREGRGFSENDAVSLLREVERLGCNFVRFAHYAPFEKLVRMAEEKGLMIWLEIPTWQRINFENPATVQLGATMVKEMIARDKNRCGVIFWSVANETPISPARNEALSSYIDLCRELDDSRLITAAFDNITFDDDSKSFKLNDPVADRLDVVSVNKYFGWYHAWPAAPAEVKMEIAPNKPFIYSEFGCEAQYGLEGDGEMASSWSEQYQEQLYKDHAALFNTIPNLRGVSPWVLYDFKSPYRMHQSKQSFWNRKGLISDRGLYKKSWYVMYEYYKELQKR